jgi:hypothetical protein
MSLLSLPTLAQTAALLLAVAAALLAGALLGGALVADALVAGALLALVLELLQPARTAAATTAAAHSTLHPLAVMPAACKTPLRAASPAPGEGKRARAVRRGRSRQPRHVARQERAADERHGVESACPR